MNTNPSRLIDLHRLAATQCSSAACPPADALLAAALGDTGAHLSAAREALASCPSCAAAAQRALAVHRDLSAALPADQASAEPVRGQAWLALAACSALFALVLAVAQSPGSGPDAAGLAGLDAGGVELEPGERMFASSFNEERPDRIFRPAML